MTNVSGYFSRPSFCHSIGADERVGDATVLGDADFEKGQVGLPEDGDAEDVAREEQRLGAGEGFDGDEGFGFGGVARGGDESGNGGGIAGRDGAFVAGVGPLGAAGGQGGDQDERISHERLMLGAPQLSVKLRK